MASTGASLCPTVMSSVFGREVRPSAVGSSKFKSNNKVLISTRRLALSAEQPAAATVGTEWKEGGLEKGMFEEKPEEEEAHRNTRIDVEEEKEKGMRKKHGSEKQVFEVEEERMSLKDYFDQAKDLIKSSSSDGGPPRWFSPLECGSRSSNSPLLLFLPGTDGVGLGLIRHHRRIGKIFDIWCLHIPVKDRTTFRELVKLVERTVKSEHRRSPNRPIYLVGETLGACLALSVAALNPDIDLVLILANPATSFDKSQLQPLIPLLEFMPDSFQLSLPYILSLMTGNSLRMVTASLEKGYPLQHTVEELSRDLFAVPSYLSVLADILPRETILWKLRMLKSASAFANSRLHSVKAEILVLSSGRDQLLPSQEEGKRLFKMLPKCEIRRFEDSGHFLLLEDDFDLVTVIKGACFYRRSKQHDYISDYMPPTATEFKKIVDSYNWFHMATSPAMFSTLDNGKIVRGLAGIPSEGPVLLVGYHMLLGLEKISLVSQFLIERNILVRGIAHPMMFMKFNKGRLSELTFDALKIMGAVPVSGKNFFKLFSSNSHVLLYPGGMREALHRKGEEYKLFWPEQSEFVRMAARFGAKIIPFGAVGEDDIGEVFLDYDDQVKIPYFRDYIEETKNEIVRLRTENAGEVANQDPYLPGVLPKFPGRFYYYFGKPIETKDLRCGRRKIR
ncbi:phytyl ester synthase 1, chloroplastic isoform X2 [Ziziphus jujuba]|uniref:Phytyl ester synthase 1, chloroplastic isoform X2 n=1 Tax=Ziziphus jujuba TaxID=326968 RepID=A0ABM3IWQ3_ZIZJJ|nr:phytyl ester synthase 1, chloroplastic isoform X2 [Ziziphus jujuba]